MCKNRNANHYEDKLAKLLSSSYSKFPDLKPMALCHIFWHSVLNLEIKKQIYCKKYQPYIPTSLKINNLQNRNDMDLANQIDKRSKMGSK